MKTGHFQYEESSTVATLLTPEQKKLMETLKRVGMKKPKRTIPEPKVHTYDVAIWHITYLLASICRISF